MPSSLGDLGNGQRSPGGGIELQVVILLDPERRRTPPGRHRHTLVRGRGMALDLGRHLPDMAAIQHTQDGISYLAPEMVLLFKAKHGRPKDQADFDATVPHMTRAQRQTPAALLARAHQGHPWLADL